FVFFFQAEDGIRDRNVTGVQTCALPICGERTSEAGARDILALPLEALEGEGELLAGLARLGAHVAAVAEGAVAQGPADHVVDETLRDQRLHAVLILGATDLG